MKRSWKFDHDVKAQFTVNAIVDLNNDANAAQPGEIKKSKTLCCLCCARYVNERAFKIQATIIITTFVVIVDLLGSH